MYMEVDADLAYERVSGISHSFCVAGPTRLGYRCGIKTVCE